MQHRARMTLPPTRILVACDKFKGSLNAATVTASIARGLAMRFPDAFIDLLPIADGGEGLAAALEAPLGGAWVSTPAHDPLGRRIDARYLLAERPEGRTAVIEMSEASGMWRIRGSGSGILRASTFGTGELMRHAVLESGADHLVVGLGGSATNDGGIGMAAAIGVRFLDEAGSELEPVPIALHGKLARIDTSGMLPMPQVTAACDVDNPLLGPSGATAVFGPQKGADADDLVVLEETLALLVRISQGDRISRSPGAGAAGGLGFGLMQFAGARMVPGFAWLASLIGLRERIAAASWIVTGEGSLDSQSLGGKGPVAIARMARQLGKPITAFCGRVDADILASRIFDSVIPLTNAGLPLHELVSRAAELLELAATKADFPPPGL